MRTDTSSGAVSAFIRVIRVIRVIRDECVFLFTP